MANDLLKLIERCLDMSHVSSLRILVGMLLDSANFLGFTFEIISIISFFAQGEMKKFYMKMEPLTELLKVFVIVVRSVTV